MDLKSLWTSLDWAIVLIYFAGMILVGFIFQRRAGSSLSSFFLAARKFTIPILIGTAAASWYESWTVVGLAECGATMGISVIFIYVVPTALLRIPLANIIGPYIRDKVPDWVVTMPDLIEYLYDKKTKLIGAVLVITTILYASALLFAVGEVLHLITGMNLFLAMVICGAIVALYTSMAGLWAVGITDIFQFAIMTFAASMLVWPLVAKTQGLAHLFDLIRAQDPTLLTTTGTSTPWDILAWVAAAAALYASPQSYQRFGAARSGAEARVAYNMMMFIGISFSAIMVLTGMVARAYYPALKPSLGFWSVVFEVLPMGMRGAFVAALAAAVMSTVDTDFLIASTVLVKDLYKDFLKPTLSEQSVIRANRLAIPIFVALMVFGTQFFQEGIGKAWYYVGGFETSAFMIPLVAGLFYKRSTIQGGFWALLGAVAFYPLWEFILKSPGGIPANVATWIVSAVVYFGVCNITYKGTAARPSVAD